MAKWRMGDRCKKTAEHQNKNSKLLVLKQATAEHVHNESQAIKQTNPKVVAFESADSRNKQYC